MKAKICLSSLLTIATFLQAETLEMASEMRLNPAPDAPVLLTLPAGTEITPLIDADLPTEMDPAPEGLVGDSSPRFLPGLREQ